MGNKVPGNRIVMVGPQNAGKTTILYRLKTNELIQTSPTIGFNIEVVPDSVFGFDVLLWEGCGQKQIRPHLKPLVVNPDGSAIVQGVIFVVDSASLGELDDAREYLHSYLSMPELRGIPFLIIANKQDLPDAVSVDGVREALQLNTMKDAPPFLIHGTIATTGDGLDEATREFGSVIRQHVKIVTPGWTSVILSSLEYVWQGIDSVTSWIRARWTSWTTVKPCRILMLGLDGAGKTACLYKYLNTPVTMFIPTVGANVEHVTSIPGSSSPFQIWDVGGQTLIRRLWGHYLTDISGLIYVVDSVDRERFELAKKELIMILELNNMPAEVPVVVMANKQDNEDACSLSEVTEKLDLETVLSRNPSFIQAVSGKNGEGLQEGFQQLASMVQMYTNTSNKGQAKEVKK